METIVRDVGLEGADLDTFIAEKVMGWKWVADEPLFSNESRLRWYEFAEDGTMQWTGYQLSAGRDSFSPSRWPDACFVVQSHLIAQGWWFVKAVQQGQATIIARHEQHDEYSHTAETEVLALARVYAAIGGAMEQESADTNKTERQADGS